MAEPGISAQQDVFHSEELNEPSVYEAFAVPDENGLFHITFAVDGVHCAGCIQKIESALHSDDAVRAARLNFSTQRLNIAWDGLPDYADHLAETVESLGYKVHPFDPRDLSRDSEKEGRFLLLCLGVSGFAAGNLMLLSFALWGTTSEVMGMAMREFMHLVAALIALPTVAFSGRPFFYSALSVLKKGRTNMDVPISLALLLASGMSVFEMLRHGEHVYFDSAVMLIFFLLIGRYLDFKARASARSTAGGLLSMMSGTARVIDEGGRMRSVPIRDLRADMIVRVGTGERIPADCRIIDGESEIDTSLVTGESLPQAVRAGDDLYSGTLNLSAPLKVEIARAAEDSLLAGIVRLMEQAEQGQALYVRIADKAAQLYTPVVHSLALLTFLGWLFLGGLIWQDALLISITVLIITCPCALGLAVPVVQVLAIGRLMKSNILVKSGDALERLAAIDTVLLDKTGTLTLGRPALERNDYPQDIMQLAASMAAQSHHPLSKALSEAYDGALFDLKVEETPGQGLTAQWNGKALRLGRREWCKGEALPSIPGKLEMFLSVKGEEPVQFLFSDPLRPDAKEVLDTLRGQGMRIYLLSGDRDDAVQDVAVRLGIENWHGTMTPADKFDLLSKLNEEGRKTLMIGDGLNDAPVLAGAHVSMSPSTAIDMAQNAADMIFMGEGLKAVLTALDTARYAQTLVKQNFILAILYNIVAVPLAVAGFVTPMIAAIAMSGSSIMVVANSFRLRWRKIA